ncbi:MAG: HAD family hydrolase [Lachnospiraceae bacterium]|nr:HAD family hydrolase [Lachnospiraceae bacterium]
MKYKAVIFDLFETLITEWGHKKYTKNEMCSDLGIEREKFDTYWDEKEKERYLGEISFEDSILYVCEKCGKHIDDSTLTVIADKRIQTKSTCFEYVNPDVFRLLSSLKSKGLQLAIISNCSSEEVKVIKQSKIYKYFNQVILSYEVKMQKPDSRIYKTAADLLGVALNECIFVGDGGSNELKGAKIAGMEAVQAKWYTNQHPCKRDSMPGFLTAEEPLDILQYIK